MEGLSVDSRDNHAEGSDCVVTGLLKNQFHKENGGTGGRRYFDETAALPGCEDGSAKAGQSRPEILSGRQDGRKGHHRQGDIRNIV